MAKDPKFLAFGIVVGATILSIAYHLTVPSSALRSTFPVLGFGPPPPPSSIQDMVVKQSIIGTPTPNNQLSQRKSNGSELKATSDFILLAMRKERRNFILHAREKGINLTAGEEFLRLFPPVFTCPYKEERLGGMYFGKWACGIRELYGVANKKDLQTPIRTCVMYSFGVGPEVAFDEGILKITNCKVFAYDHTVKNGIPSQTSESKDPRRMAYQKIGVEEYEKFNSTYLKSIKQLMDLNGHDWIDILKVDTEGAEWGSLNMLMDDFEDVGILPFDQLVVEVHKYAIHNLYSLVLPWFNRMEGMGLRVIHAEKGNPRCICYEYSFVNVRGRVFRNSTFSFFKKGWTDMRQYTSQPNIKLPFQVV